jgi:hypothetical protein
MCAIACAYACLECMQDAQGELVIVIVVSLSLFCWAPA